MESENRHEFDVTIATFARAALRGSSRTGEIFDGEEAVRGYFTRRRARAFPDQRNELRALHHTDDAVISEFRSPRHASRTAARIPADREGAFAVR